MDIDVDICRQIDIKYPCGLPEIRYDKNNTFIKTD